MLAGTHGTGASTPAPLEREWPADPVGHADGGSASAKRVLDVLVAGVTLVLLAPLILAAMALIAITMGFPVVFSHPRIGKGGRVFKCYKLRTMHVDGARILAEHFARNPAAREEWERTSKLMHDPRVTPLGHALRKASIDELPQLVNVLKGDMSCVGPRPITAAEMPRYGECLEDYLSVRPGLTGLWQISGRSRTGFDERVRLDATYVRRWSLWLDLAILIRTAPAVLRFGNTA